MSGDNLAIYLFLWGTTFAFGLAAITMVGTGRKIVSGLLWASSAIFLMIALAWPLIAAKWPEAKAVASSISGNQVAVDALGLTIFALLVLDFAMRRKWIARSGPAPNADLHSKQIEQLKGKIYALEATGGTTHDILMLTHFAIYQSTVQMLDDLLSAAPVDGFDHPLQLGGNFELENEAAKDFVDLVRKKLDAGSLRRSNFESIMLNAASAAEREVEETPMEQRPAGIDPLMLRRWAIVNRQCSRAVAFLKHEKKEAEDNLRGQRHDLLERYRSLSKQ